MQGVEEYVKDIFMGLGIETLKEVSAQKYRPRLISQLTNNFILRSKYFAKYTDVDESADESFRVYHSYFVFLALRSANQREKRVGFRLYMHFEQCCEYYLQKEEVHVLEFFLNERYTFMYKKNQTNEMLLIK